MMPKKTNRLQVDDSPTGSLLPCPLCSQRFMRDTPIDAWRALYDHLRHHHSSPHAAQLTQRTRLRIARMTWESRQKESTPKP